MKAFNLNFLSNIQQKNSASLFSKILKYQKFNIFNINKNKLCSMDLKNTQFLKNNKFFFTKKENDNDNDDIHSDFKPQTKIEINDDNVMQLVDEWIKNNDVVIFMKGTREMPRCGFSNYAVQLLKFYNIKNVKVVNILENTVVRDAVKKYSNWPTYPQLYVKGNLIGNNFFDNLYF